MDIKIGDKVVGNMYMNIQLPLSSFEGKSDAEIIDKIKGANGHDQQVFETVLGKFKISSFRRIYNDREKLCVEGAVLEAAVLEAA